MKKLSETMQIGIVVIGLGIAYVAFKGKAGEGGTGGGAAGIDVPFDWSSLFSGFGVSVPAPVPSDIVESQPVQPTQALLDNVKTSFINFTSKGEQYSIPSVGGKDFTQAANFLQKKGDTGSFLNFGIGAAQYSLPADFSKKVEPVFRNTQGGSSGNQGGTWIGSTFYQGKYT